MKYNITGTTLPILELTLDKEESVYSQSGALLVLGKDVEMQTELKGGLLQGLRRMSGGESLCICKYKSNIYGGKVMFSDPTLGMIIPVEIKRDSPLLCDRSSFLCCASTVEFDVAFMKRVRDILFSGEGIVLQKLFGDGLAFLHCWGEVTEYNLNKDESIQVSSGNVVAFSSTVNLKTRLLKGGKNILFGGEGVFITELTGPGKVIVQSVDKKDFKRMIREV